MLSRGFSGGYFQFIANELMYPLPPLWYSAFSSPLPFAPNLMKLAYLRSLVACAFLLLLPSFSSALVRQPNGEYQESVEELAVKVPGGVVRVVRTWQAEELNKGQFRWHMNPAWADLSLTYDSLDGSVKEVRRAGSVFAKKGDGVFVFDELYWIKQTTSPAGFRWWNLAGEWITYDSAGKIVAFGNRYGTQAQFTRNTDGKIHEVRDRHAAVVLTYDYNGTNVSGIATADGRSVSYQYTNSQLTQATDGLGNTWQYSYSGGLLSGITDPEGKTTSITYKGNRVVRMTDPMGYQTHYSYSYDRVKRVYTTVETSPTNTRTETRYDKRGQVMFQQIGTRVVRTLVKDGKYVQIEVDERGGQTRTVLDVNRMPLEILYPDGTKETNTYTAQYGQLASHTDALGNQTTYQYDAKGNLTQQVEAVGKPEQRTTLYTYDNDGQRLTQTIKGLTPPAGVTPDPTDTAYHDATTTWTYDAKGNVASVIDPEGNTTTFTDDAMGNGLTRTDALNHTTTTTYNANGWPVTLTDPLGKVTTLTYDAAG